MKDMIRLKFHRKKSGGCWESTRSRNAMSAAEAVEKIKEKSAGLNFEKAELNRRYEDRMFAYNQPLRSVSAEYSFADEDGNRLMLEAVIGTNFGSDNATTKLGLLNKLLPAWAINEEVHG